VQEAIDAAEVSSFDYAIYVDDARTVVQDATCSPTRGPQGFECSAPLPQMSPGRHSIQVATLEVVAGGTVESARSAAIEVNVTAASASAAPVAPPSARGGTTRDRGARAQVIATGLHDPSDLAADQATVFVAERAGRILHIAQGSARVAFEFQDADAATAGLASIALHPGFGANRLLYASLVSQTGGGPSLRIVRMREAGGLLGEAAVVFEEPVDEPPAHIVMRFGPDGLLYVAVGAGVTGRGAQSPSDIRGKILRLNADGTTPRDNPRASPVLTLGHRDVQALVWDAAGTLWALEHDEIGDEVNRAAADTNYGWPLVRGAASQRPFAPPALTLEAGTEVAGGTFGPDASDLARTLLVASRGRQGILLLPPDVKGSGIRLDALFEGEFGRIGPLSATRTSVYFVTANADEWGAGQDLLARIDFIRRGLPSR
jgi:glucose/arabinose dehydrogenase